MIALRWPCFAAFLFGFLSLGAQAEVRLVCPAGYLPGVPFLARVELRNDAGAVDRRVWNGEALLAADSPEVTLSTNRVQLRNGLGTALLTIAGETNFVLTAQSGGGQAARAVRYRGAEVRTGAQGTLTDLETAWSGVVEVTGTVTVPEGHTLTILPDTLVVIAGAAGGSGAPGLIVNGAVRSLGTEAGPVTITAREEALNWGQIAHRGSSPSVYQYTLISKAGRARAEGHTGTSPALRLENANVTLEDSVVSDLTAESATIGKAMMATDSELRIERTVFARARMGPEIAGTGLLCADSYFMDMTGPDDADGLYLHNAGSRALAVRRCVFAHGNDDAIDTLSSKVLIEDCILRDWSNPAEDAKGISAFNGEVEVRRALFANCYVGASIKSSGAPGTLRLDRCTIYAIEKGVSAATKANASAGSIAIYLRNSIVRAADSIHSDFGPEKFAELSHCNLGEAWPGEGNGTADPMLIDPAAGDFRPAPGSPCIDAASVDTRDGDGSRGDIGFYSGQSLGGVTINEIMYHPASGNPLDEYIELLNRGAAGVNLDGWRFSDGIGFAFTNVSLAAGGYLVVAADVATFRRKYPGVTNVVGNWTGSLGNRGGDIDLDDARGERADSVRYADEGDWAERQRGPLDRGYRGWIWSAPHDGQGKSLELVNPSVSNSSGQNWAASGPAEGTPGGLNSAFEIGTAPVIERVSHAPIVPRTTENVLISARVSGGTAPGISAVLNWRLDGVTPAPWVALAMRDDGAGGDALPGDGVFTALVPTQTNAAVVEFFVTAADGAGRMRVWPKPALGAPGAAGGQFANALYQVDDSEYSGAQPLYKIIMTEVERLELQAIGNNVGGSSGSDAQMNGTFIGIDGTGTELRYLAGIRNRGHGTRVAKPNNFRVNFRSDERWKGVLAINLNAQFPFLQVLGSALHLESGMAGAYSRAVQVRVNNANLIFTGGIQRTYGSYAANEVIDADWAGRHFPNDGEGNVYRALRDINPAEFDYRTAAAYPFLSGPEDKNSYTNTWRKATNESGDDWRDLIAMLRVIGPNGTEPFTEENVRRAIDPEQWLRHLAVMNLLGNSETGLNGGYNDDYYLYRGVNDPRFILIYYDLDQILGFNNSFGPQTGLFTAANNQGAGRALGRLLNDPVFQPVYYEALRQLLETSFSQAEFNATVEQTLGSFVPEAARAQIKSWMDTRRSFVLQQLPPPAVVPRATVRGTPRSPTPRTGAEFEVAGEEITHYRHRLNGGGFGPETPVTTPIVLANLPDGSNTLAVIGRDESGRYQPETAATEVSWRVDRARSGLRLNEILASGNGPDQLEIYNEGDAPADLPGIRLSDQPDTPGQYIFAGGSLAPRAYLTIDTRQLPFGLSGSGDRLYLFDKAAAGDAPLDSVEWGGQIPGYSFGRIGNAGEWVLTQPTFGSANIAQPVAPAGVKINEWLTAGVSPFPDDFVELFNPGELPAAIGGSYLTDQRAGNPTRSRIAPLTFLPPRGYLAFTSGNGSSADEISFDPAAEQGQIALLAPDLAVIDSIVYGPQRLGVAEGRCPDGGPARKPLAVPSPGAMNQCPPEPVPPQRIALVPFGQVWRYEDSGADLGTNWRQTVFDDSRWKNGPALIGFENDPLPQPLLTSFPNPRVTTYYFRTSFRAGAGMKASAIEIAHLVDDGAAFYLNGREIGTPYNLPPLATAQSFALNSGEATLQTFTIGPELLLPGENVLAAEVHQYNSFSTDMVFGMRVDALVVTNDSSASGVVINEVLARNVSFKNSAGRSAGWIELYNPSSNAVDLAGMSLSRDEAEPGMWMLPAGSIVAGNGWLVVEADGNSPPSSSNTGFSLRNSGGAIYLFDSPARGGALRSSVRYGIQASDWSIGRTPDGTAAWTLTIPTPGAANRVATLGNPAALEINEWLANPAGDGDWFEIYNPEPEPVSLAGLGLSDTLASVKSTLPELSFLGVGARGFLRIDADGDTAAGPDHAAFSLAAGGEALVLTDARGAVIDAVSFGAQTRGVSEGRLPDGSDARRFFPESASPGAANYLPLAEVAINEILTHSDPPLEDAVEFYNPSGAPVDLSGWFLSDSPLDLRKYQLPANTVLPPGGYAVIYEHQFNGDDAADPFALDSSDGEEIFLSQAAHGALTGHRASARFGAAPNGVSFGRVATSQGPRYALLTARTFGKDHPATVEEFRTGTGARNASPLVGPVTITEIMFNPPATDQPLEFVELRNIGPGPAPLFDPAAPNRTWRVRGGVDFDFPEGVTLAPGEFLLLVDFNPAADAAALARFRAAYAPTGRLFGPFDGALDNAGETVALQFPEAGAAPGSGVPYITADQVDYSPSAPWPVFSESANRSLQKRLDGSFGNEPWNWAAAAPTAGRALLTDSDADGMPDDWERQFGLDPAAAGDAALDPDRDGLSNVEEYQADTDPTFAQSTLRLTVVRRGSEMVLEWPAAPDRAYEILGTGSLGQPWRVLAQIPPGSAGRLETATLPIEGNASYYKVRARVP